jgi:catechol 2,3-dioxygenase-like lactoylglutathione lyase family enzyme
MVGPAIYVSDPARSLKFYAEGLGMKLRMRFGPPDRADMVIGFGMDPTEAGIMLLTDKEGAVQRPIQHSHGFDRIALRLPNLPAVSERLRKAGFAAGEIRTVHGSISMMMVTDPDGYRIELIDSQPPSKQP